MDMAERHEGMAAVSGARAAALAGMAAPVVFFVGVTLSTYLSRDFLEAHGWTFTDHGDVPWPSGTALAEHGWITNATFAVTGLLLLAFVGALRREFRRRRSGRVASGLLIAMGAAVTALTFNTDLAVFGNTDGAPETWHGWLHGIAFVVLGLTSLTAFFAAALAFRGNPHWHWFTPVSAAAGVGVIVFGWFELAALNLWRLATRG
jgi:hypothetical protein